MAHPNEYIIRLDESKGYDHEAMPDLVVEARHEASINGIDGWVGDSEVAEGLVDFTRGKAFRRLTISEKGLSLRAMNNCFNAGQWGYDYGIRPVDVLGTSMPLLSRSVVAATPFDALILSGAYGDVLLRDSEKDFRKLVRTLPNEGLLARLRLVGALAFSAKPIDKELVSAPVRRDKYSVDSYVGSDLNGDFVTGQIVAPYSGFVDPSGMKQEFAPVISHETVRSMYTTQVPLLRGILGHLRQGLSPEERGEVLNLLQRTVPDEPGKNTMMFANFGGVSDLSLHDTLRERDRDETYNEGEYLAVGYVLPAVKDLLFGLVHHEGWIELREFVRVDEGGQIHDKTRASVNLNDREIPDYLRRMLQAQGSRASDEELMWTVRTMLG